MDKHLGSGSSSLGYSYSSSISEPNALLTEIPIYFDDSFEDLQGSNEEFITIVRRLILEVIPASNCYS
jgi:hypothetical protein